MPTNAGTCHTPDLGSVPTSSEILEMGWKQLQSAPGITFFQFPEILLDD